MIIIFLYYFNTFYGIIFIKCKMPLTRHKCKGGKLNISQEEHGKGHDY